MRLAAFAVFFASILQTLHAQFSLASGPTFLFRENKGQVSDQDQHPRNDVLFSGSSGNMAFHLKSNGISYQLYKATPPSNETREKDPRKFDPPAPVSIYRLDVDWVNANPGVSIETSAPSGDYDNFYLASCPQGVTGVHSYEWVAYKNIYRGIDLKYYSSSGSLKYDFIVQPHSDYRQIKLKVSGASSITKDDRGNIVIQTPLGNITEGAPIVHQCNKTLKSEWKIDKDMIFLSIEGVDLSRELIIDPLVRVWGTYYGGSNGDEAYSSSLDANGNLYVAGNTASSNGTVIATTGSHQTTYAGSTDAFMVKFNTNGVRQWGTYYGGSNLEVVKNCVCSGSYIYMSGHTSSTTAIATTGTQQLNYGGGLYDAFLVKFNTSGVRQWGTYYGGTGDEFYCACCVDANGNIFIGGSTAGSSGLTTNGCHQSAFGGNEDGFIAKFNSSGIRQWGTYYGGNGLDNINDVTVDPSGNLYCSGQSNTTTSNIISTSGSHQPVNGGSDDAFLVKFNTGGVRQWGTYYGGANGDVAYGCSTDASGNIFFTGKTTSTDTLTISTTGCQQPIMRGASDGFLTKFNSAGVRQWGTYYGGPFGDYGQTCRCDNGGNVYLCGITSGGPDSNIATNGSHQYVYGGGSEDAFLVKFTATGQRQWGTFYGGSNYDEGQSCSVDGNGITYLVGWTASTGSLIISSNGSHQLNYGGNNDAFIAQFFDCANSNVTFTFTAGDTLCLYGPPVPLSGGYPTGGTYTGNAIYGSQFYPDSASLGWNVITYTKSFSQNCTDFAMDSVYIDLCYTSVANENHDEDFFVFPNPIKDQLHIKSSERVEEIRIFNSVGGIVKIIFPKAKEFEVDLGDQPAGFYFIQAYVNGKYSTQKIIKQ